ncbi:MAG TPA: cytochrome b/b6 domain-containing protein [Bacteriovoracaceae bacterium]|nr:cytochrome b/b6 domain-containing protein [Bacteriovoracaceae bacterium]
MKTIVIYKGFERFWHWSQTTLISLLIISGFEIHGTYSILGFTTTVTLHNFLAWLLMILILFAIFWHFTTGEWKQYIPTTEKLLAVMRYYILGIFKGEHHPADKSVNSKLNPMQRLAYLQLKLFLIPLQIFSGVLYYYYNNWSDINYFLNHFLAMFASEYTEINFFYYLTLERIAIIHAACAYALAMFIVIHVYLTTTGHTVWAHIQSMITGLEEVPDDHDKNEHGHGHGHDGH